MPTEISENKIKATSFANELYIVPSKASLFIFDAHTDQNIAKLKLKGEANNTLVYLQNTQEYFLLAVYKDMWLDIFTIKYLKEQGLRTIVEINRQEIDLQPNDKINKNYRIKHIYIQEMVQSVDNLYYSLIVKVSIANKSRLFVKNMLQYG